VGLPLNSQRCRAIRQITQALNTTSASVCPSIPRRHHGRIGKEVVTLLNDELQAAGYHVAIGDGRNKLGEVVGSGIYIHRFRAGSFTSIKKMALAK
jgi:hypothetical protein